MKTSISSMSGLIASTLPTKLSHLSIMKVLPFISLLCPLGDYYWFEIPAHGDCSGSSVRVLPKKYEDQYPRKNPQTHCSFLWPLLWLAETRQSLRLTVYYTFSRFSKIPFLRALTALLDQLQFPAHTWQLSIRYSSRRSYPLFISALFWPLYVLTSRQNTLTYTMRREGEKSGFCLRRMRCKVIERDTWYCPWASEHTSAHTT